MVKLPRPRRRQPRIPISRIKAGCTYDTNDIAKLLGVHRNTVRHWLKRGLEGPPEAIENCDFEEDLAHAETEPAE
jgi:Homeodomain-like domain